MLRANDFSFIFPEIRAEKRSYVIGVSLVVMTALFLVANPWFIGKAVTALESGVREDMVPYFALALVGAVMLRGLTQFWMRRVVIGASRRIEFNFRNRLFRHLESLDASYFGEHHTGDLMSRFTSDVDAVRMTVGPGVMYLTNTVFTFTFGMIYMFSVSPRLALWSLMPLALLTVVIRWLGPRVHRESMAGQERLAEISVHAQENFSNARVVKAFVREHAEIARMQHHSDRYFDQNMRLARLRALTHGLLWLMGDLLVLVLLGIGGWELIEGRIDLGEFAAFKSCQLLLMWPMIALGWVMTLFQRGAASAKRLRDVIDAVPRIDDATAVCDASVTEGSIRFEGIGFEYDSGRGMLDGVDFELAAGQTLGIVGPTGCGKTTLLGLLPRIHPATAGRILVDERPVEQYPLRALRQEIAVVPQEAFLFSTSIAGNISFAHPEASPEAIHAVADLVGIHDEIVGFPHGYDQRVGERGITLSGGQKQRIALARALIGRPKILILDDVLSAVDARTEAHILDGLRSSTEKQTVLIASHRLSTVRHADLIIVLNEGRVVQRGDHDELLSKDGYYRSLFRKQTIEEELENL